jgi:hypothetical protein|tara:strand:- start:2503 stop:3108 length:606 start_codon:yes stop_codon:yes gene_type:complete
MANPTTNLNIILPEPGAESSKDTWGTTLNNAIQSLDTGIATRGIPTGGTDDQILIKNGATDFATEWTTRTSFSAAEQTKLSGIETSATADQTNTEIKTAYEANSDTNEFSDAEQTKLSGIATSATVDQTITASGDATGSGTTALALTLANSGVSAASYGTSTTIPVLAIDVKGRITSASTVAVSIGSAADDAAVANAIALG